MEYEIMLTKSQVITQSFNSANEADKKKVSSVYLIRKDKDDESLCTGFLLGGQIITSSTIYSENISNIEAFSVRGRLIKFTRGYIDPVKGIAMLQPSEHLDDNGFKLDFAADKNIDAALTAMGYQSNEIDVSNINASEEVLNSMEEKQTKLQLIVAEIDDMAGYLGSPLLIDDRVIGVIINTAFMASSLKHDINQGLQTDSGNAKQVAQQKIDIESKFEKRIADCEFSMQFKNLALNKFGNFSFFNTKAETSEQNKILNPEQPYKAGLNSFK